MEDLRQRLLDIYNLYQVNKRYNDAIAVADNEIRNHVHEYNRLKNLRYSLKGWIFLIVFGSIFLGSFLLLVAGFISEANFPNEVPGLVGLYIVAAVMICVSPWATSLLFIFGVHSRRNKKLRLAAEKYKQEILTPIIYKNTAIMEKNEEERDTFWKNNCHVLSFLPHRYRTEIAATCLMQYVRDGRADTLKEALNLYEDQLHKWEMLEHAKALEEQNRLISLQNELMSSYLEEIADQQSRIASSVREIENLEFYNTFCQ